MLFLQKLAAKAYHQNAVDIRICQKSGKHIQHDRHIFWI